MQRKLLTLAFLALVAIPNGDLYGAPPEGFLEAPVDLFLDGSEDEREAAIPLLRAWGAPGLEALLEGFGEGRLPERGSPESLSLDRVCGQRDCAASRLFWYTDLEGALAEARRENRPILSLRLLGRLDEDLSCANSRFFRTALYPDPAVSEFLRREFVLHWHSVRPVPKLTVEYGDGRKLEGTVTGNSVHYVLDSEGRMVDALPGLYSPQTFLREIRDAARVARKSAELADAESLLLLRSNHRTRVEKLDGRLQEDLKLIGRGHELEILRVELEAFAALMGSPGSPSAADAAVLASSKAIVEEPAVRAFNRFSEDPEGLPGDEIWKSLARARSAEDLLAPASQALLREIHGSASPEDAEKALRGFEATMALDTVRNQYVLRRTLHRWLEERPEALSLAALDQSIYADLFRTPLSDPWFGLRRPEVYSGVPITQEIAEQSEGSLQILTGQVRER